MNFKVIKDTLNPLIDKAVCICMLSSPLGCQVFFWGGVGGPGEAADKNWNGETQTLLLSLLSFSYIYFLNKLDFLFLLSSFSINKNFLRLFAKEAMSQAKQTPRPQVHLKVGTEHLGCWTSYSARTSFGPFKKKKKKKTLKTTGDWAFSHREIIMNYFTPREGFTGLILYANILSPLLSLNPVFLCHAWPNSLHTGSLLNTPSLPQNSSPQEATLFVGGWKQYTSTG